ncbi:hypothetical protein RPX00_35400 [Amycolatopsis sp. WGS_07]
MHDAVAHRGERVEALAERELLHRRFELRAAAAHVVDDGVAAHVLPRVFDVDPVRLPGDDDREFPLVVGAGFLARDHDVVVRSDDRGRQFREHERHVRPLEAGFLDVRLVVEPDREDLRRRNRREQRDVGDAVPRAGGGLDRGPVLRRRNETGGGGRTGGDDRVAFRAAEEPAAVCGLEVDGLGHRCLPAAW